MARARDDGIPWYAVRALEKSARLGGAANIYSHLSTDADLAAAQARRDEFARDMRYLRHCMAQGVSEDEPPAQPRPRTTQADLARAIYSDEFDAYREKYAQWQQAHMPWGFRLKGR
jgi:hypothetical protein